MTSTRFYLTLRDEYGSDLGEASIITRPLAAYLIKNPELETIHHARGYRLFTFKHFHLSMVGWP